MASLIIALSVPFTASATTFSENGISYTLNNNTITATVVGVDHSLTNVVIPQKVSGYPVTTIGNGAFSGSDGITSVTIPEGVLRIESNAFNSCDNLASVTLPETLTSIGVCAFSYCKSLKIIKLPASLEKMESSAFSGSGLTEIAIPEKITELELNMFQFCFDLSQVTLHNSLTRIGASAFEGTTSLEAISLPSSLTEIGDYAFRHSALNSVVISENVKTVGVGAFMFCESLKSVQLNGICAIKESAFESCTALTYINIPGNITTIPQKAFANCIALKEAVISHGVKFIENSAFEGCSALNCVTIPYSIRKLGNSITSDSSAIKAIYYNGTEKQLASLIGASEHLNQISKALGVYGDFDGDFVVTCEDALILCKYLAGIETNTAVSLLTADINNDGIVNAKDQFDLKKLLCC